MQSYKNIIVDRKDAAAKLMDVIPMNKLKEEAWDIVAVSRGGLEVAACIKG